MEGAGGGPKEGRGPPGPGLLPGRGAGVAPEPLGHWGRELDLTGNTGSAVQGGLDFVSPCNLMELFSRYSDTSFNCLRLIFMRSNLIGSIYDPTIKYIKREEAF